MTMEEVRQVGTVHVVFDVSYGGMLSVYMRIRYPNIVTGALVLPSCPPQVLETLDSFSGMVQLIFRSLTLAAEMQCKELNTLAQQKDYRRIQSAFSLCKTPSTPKDIHQLNGLLHNAFTIMVMLDYPYSTHFMGSMPAFPVKVACQTMLNGTDLMSALRDTVGIVYNSTGQLTCYDLYSLYVECADPTGCGLGFDSYAWDYQANPGVCITLVLMGFFHWLLDYCRIFFLLFLHILFIKIQKAKRLH